jgi:hypothetical protein
MEQYLLAAPLQYGTLEIVVENLSRLARPSLKGMHMAAQKILHRLIEEKLQIQSAGIRQCHHQARQRALGAAHHHMAKVRPIDLRLLTRKHLQLQERFAAKGTQRGNNSA